MNDTQKLSFIMTQVAVCQATLIMMQEQNRADREAGRPVSYAPSQFSDAPEHMGLGYNDAIRYITGD